MGQVSSGVPQVANRSFARPMRPRPVTGLSGCRARVEPIGKSGVTRTWCSRGCSRQRYTLRGCWGDRWGEPSHDNRSDENSATVSITGAVTLEFVSARRATLFFHVRPISAAWISVVEWYRSRARRFRHSRQRPSRYLGQRLIGILWNQKLIDLSTSRRQ
jgi:hypothetical protein